MQGFLRLSWMVGIIALLLLYSCEEKVEVKLFGTVTGTVLSTSQQPIANAVISSNPASTSVLTDSSGTFTLTNVPVGDVSITAKKTDFTTTSSTVNVIDGATISVTLTMSVSAVQVDPALNVTPTPVTDATDQELSDTLRWSMKKAQNYTFDVLLYESNSPNQYYLAQDIADTFAVYEGLKFGTTYFWQVLIKEDGTVVARSDVFNFATITFPDHRFRFARQEGGDYNVFSSDSSGATMTNLTTSSGSFDYRPLLSPTRDKIAFASNRDFNPHIYTMRKSGIDVQKVTPIPVAGNYNQGQGYCWSPNGAQLLFCHYDRLYLVNRDGTGLQQIATAPANRHFNRVDWNGVIDKIVAQTTGVNVFDNELYIMDEDGSNMQQITGNPDGRIDNPSFSITGAEILYTYDVSGFNSPDGRQLDARIFLMNNDSTNVRDLSQNKPNGTNDLYPRFSPDGAKIIFVNTSNTGIEQPDIFIMNVDGTNRQLLFENATMPDWY